MSEVRHFRVPPVLAAIAVTVIYSTVNVGIPLSLSSLGQRHGWSGSRVGPANLVGLVPLLVGLLVVVGLALGLQVGVRMEERGLARQFGEEWDAYARATPRFLGRPRRPPA